MPLLPLVLLLVSAAAPGADPSPPPPAFALEERLFSAAGAVPDALVKLYVSGANVRTESYSGGVHLRSAILRSDRGLVYLVDEGRKTYQEVPLAELRARGWTPFRTLTHYQQEQQRGALKLKRVGNETVRGEGCEKYVGTDVKTESSFRLWVSEKTGLPVMWAPEADGDADSRIEWSNLTVGPQPEGLFEAPAGYQKAPPAP
jgi:uncharacterized protein DUF4412